MKSEAKNIMWRRKNITLKLKILTGHFTGVQKIITLSFVILMLSFVNIINISALSYESSVGVGFTFNPTLSVSLSSSDLVISNLTPGSTADSNSINVSVATNASYGYTLSVNANSENLIHSNNTNIFSSIATDADLVSLATDNTWGYTASLDNGSTWSNYNGLSSSSSTTLLNPTSNVSSNIDFKIAAKASSTQASGAYTNTITFTAVTKPTPMTLAEAYASEGKTMINGFYTMQDMTSAICNKVEAIDAQLQVLDIRDYKVYWIAKLADGHCWMTQNLDLDLDSTRTYTHWDTDLGWSTENGNVINEDATWKPSSSTINFNGATTNQVTGWVDSNTEPYSANPGDIYYYTSNTEDNDIMYNSLQECTIAGHNDCTHYHAGNYYNWSVAAGSNDTSGMVDYQSKAENSLCPCRWRMEETYSIYSLGSLLVSYGIIQSIATNPYLDNGFYRIRAYPIYLARSGYISNGSLYGIGSLAYYNSNTIYNKNRGFFLNFNSSHVFPNQGNLERGFGYSVRCLAR